VKLFRQAGVPDGEGLRIVDILCDERILRIDDAISAPGAEVIELEGRLTLPGVIDAHVHFNDPGFPEREDFLSGTSSAAAGGITTVVDMPCTSLPPVTDTEALQFKLEAIGPKAVVDYALWGGIRGNDAPWADDRIPRLWAAGVVGFKLYPISGMDTFKAVSYDQVEDLLRRYPHLLFAFHAEDPGLIRETESRLPRPWGWREYLRSRPVEAEEVAVRQLLAVAGKARLHFVHVGAASALGTILEARARGADVTFETCPHYLAFTGDDFDRLGGRLKTAPPVKSARDREALHNALSDGSLDYLATDHAGCDWNTGKTDPDFSLVYNGIPGIQTLVPYILDEFAGRAPLPRLVALLSTNPARRLGLYPRKGLLRPGADADLTIVDTDSPHRFAESELLSRGKFSPFDGRTFRHRISMTVVRGEIVYRNDEGVTGAPGWGAWIPRPD
jgi:allantoinase